MRLTKAFGLAALAVVAAMAFITDTAAAQHEVALCKALETLCAKGNLWPSGTQLLALSQNPELLGVLPIKCEDGIMWATTLAETGSPLSIEITLLDFGGLPTPKLGEKCTGCPFGLKVEVHVLTPFKGAFKVSGVDEFKLLVEKPKVLILCGSIKCSFSIAEVESGVIKHDGSHPAHPSANNLSAASFNKALFEVLEDTSGIGACGTTTTLDSRYVVYLAHSGPNTGLAWLSLDKKA